MGFILEKPCTDIQKNNFIAKHNHRDGLVIKETEAYIFALLPNEIMLNGQPVIDPDYEIKQTMACLIQQVEQLENELEKLDIKRIRAICEPSIKDEETGETWLQYYNTQIQELRTQIQELQERMEEYDITQ